MKHSSIAVIAGILAFAVLGCGNGKSDEKIEVATSFVSAKMAGVNQPAPEIVITDPVSKKVTKLSDLRGQVVFINFWGTWCPPCKRELPALVSVHEQYADSAVFLGVLVNRSSSDRDNLGPMKEQYGIRYRNVEGSQSIFRAYGISSVPTTYIIDRQGIVRKMLVGEHSRGAFEQGLKQILAMR
jgi:cytochrome c biogenesis protein CcmG, thiol:disulfide interchange protein DsbE